MKEKLNIIFLKLSSLLTQVCLVEQRGTKKVLAMKYVNKVACAKQGGISITVFLNIYYQILGSYQAK